MKMKKGLLIAILIFVGIIIGVFARAIIIAIF